jgi:adenine-specific DNA-methyltransferase
MIKYLGSKRRLVGQIGSMLTAQGASSALDLFTGTTRVAQELKQRGAHVTAVDTATYSEIFARCYIETDALYVEKDDLRDALERLSRLPGKEGYFAETFCRQSRFFQEHNGRRIDAIREVIEDEYAGTLLYPVLLTSLIEAADRVDSTTGVQMAYLKEWAPRSYNDLQLRYPPLYTGPGTAIRGDACELAEDLGTFDFAYLDPPYNQHRYFTNYHIWETLVSWDKPETYGVACKRTDARAPSTKSAFNGRRTIHPALEHVIRNVSADLMVLSYNNEAWITLDELCDMCAHRGTVEVLSFDSKRYVGAQIGIYNPGGEKTGQVSHLRNLEHLVLSGDSSAVRRAAAVAAPQEQATLF